MTTDKACKARIRQRMAATGETYTVAARAVAWRRASEVLDRFAANPQANLAWYVTQAYACLQAAAEGRGPVEVARTDLTDLDRWTPPADAVAVVDRAGVPDELRNAVVDTIGEARYALGAWEDLRDWEAELRQSHDEDGCDDVEDGGWCHCSFGPPDYAIAEWNQLHDQAAGYGEALLNFCEAVRQWVHARTASPTTTG